MLGHDGEQRNGFLNATRLGPRVMEKGASLDHIVARVQQKNGPWVWRLGGDKRTLSPQNASMSSGVRLLTPRKTGELSRGARVGGAPATGADEQRIAVVPCCPLGAGGTLSWERPSLSFLFPCTTPHQAGLGVVDATVLPPSPLRGLYCWTKDTRQSPGSSVHQARGYGLSRPSTTHNPPCYTRP